MSGGGGIVDEAAAGGGAEEPQAEASASAPAPATDVDAGSSTRDGCEGEAVETAVEEATGEDDAGEDAPEGAAEADPAASIAEFLRKFAEHDIDAAATESIAKRHEDPHMTAQEHWDRMFGPEMVTSIMDAVIPMSGVEPKLDYAVVGYCPEDDGGIPFAVRDAPDAPPPVPTTIETELAKQVDLNAQLMQRVTNLTQMVGEIEDAIEVRRMRSDFLDEGGGTFKGLLSTLVAQRREHEDSRRAAQRVTRRRFEKSTREVDEETMQVRQDIMQLRKEINDVDKHIVAEEAAEELLQAELVKRNIPFIAPAAVNPTFTDLCLAQHSSRFATASAAPAQPRGYTNTHAHTANESKDSVHSRIHPAYARRGKVARVRDPVPSDYKPCTPDASEDGNPLPALPSPPYASCSPHAPAQ